MSNVATSSSNNFYKKPVPIWSFVAHSGVNWKCSRPGQERYIAFDQQFFLSKWWWPSCNLSTQEFTCPEPYQAIFFLLSEFHLVDDIDYSFHLVDDIDYYILYTSLCLSDSESCEVGDQLSGVAQHCSHHRLSEACAGTSVQPSSRPFWDAQFWIWMAIFASGIDKKRRPSSPLIYPIWGLSRVFLLCFLSIDHWLTWKFYIIPFCPLRTNQITTRGREVPKTLACRLENFSGQEMMLRSQRPGFRGTVGVVQTTVLLGVAA